jgi:hypothetical protein
MSDQDDQIGRLERRKHDIYADSGFWGATGLAWASADAAEVVSFSGDPESVHQLSQAYSDAARPLYDAQEALADLRNLNVDGVWSGAAHNAAADAVSALHDDVVRAFLSYQEIADHLRVFGDRLAPARRADEPARTELRQAAAEADRLTAGPIPDPFSYDGEAMRAAHHLAMSAVDTRLAAHTEARDNGRDFAAAMHDIAARARAGKMTSAYLTPLDEVVLAEAGGDTPILTPAMDKRVRDTLNTMAGADLERMTALLAAAKSPEQRAYLLKALAAGYSVDEVTRFDAMIAAHGNDPAWLDQHLSPLTMDGQLTDGMAPNAFGGTGWAQGDHPTCVAASTVTARAEVDPLYALQLTTGGHPGDSSFDNSAAFAERLKDEQNRVYDGARRWYVNGWQGGMTDAQSDQIADQEIAPRTGVTYENVEMKNQESRETVLRSAEHAVDDGYPVPVTTHEGGKGHQMMIIGHADGRVQIYNPWGYTYWVTESDFVAGKVDGIDAEIPSTPVSVRLPQETNR